MINCKKVLSLCLILSVILCGCGQKKNNDKMTEERIIDKEKESTVEVLDNSEIATTVFETEAESESNNKSDTELTIELETESQTETVIETTTVNVEKNSSNSIKTTTKKVEEKKKEETTTSSYEDYYYDDPLCNLKSYDLYYKYEYAYKYNDISELKGEEITFYNRLKEALDYAKTFSKDEYKAKAIYEWIILHNKYDYENYSNGTIPFESYYPEGVFIYGKSVCNGYATSFKLCLDIIGIPCEMVVGTAVSNGEGHAWNKYQLDGEWYQIDLTWDDGGDKCNYNYFNLTDKQMLETHNYYVSPTMPCVSTKYAYIYFYEGRYVDTQEKYNTELVNAINNNVEELVIAVDTKNIEHFANFDEISEMCGKKVLWNIGIDGIKMWYGGYVVMYITFIDAPDNIVIVHNEEELMSAIENCINEKRENITLLYSDTDDEANVLNDLETLINGYTQAYIIDYETKFLAGDDYYTKTTNSLAIYNRYKTWFARYDFGYLY